MITNDPSPAASDGPVNLRQLIEELDRARVEKLQPAAFRVSTRDLDRLRSAAARYRVPVGALVRIANSRFLDDLDRLESIGLSTPHTLQHVNTNNPCRPKTEEERR